MIPKQLQIKNFLSYGPENQIVDFVPYNLICLSGKNGHGKSALLDAITWALWGQARKTSGTGKADEGLLHLGQKHMLVTFDFEINEISYRVRREFVKTQSTPFSALDFGIVKDDNTFTTLTDKTIKLTQEKIERTIAISFESFVNSAFLRQGQSNEFSKKSPKERKEILASILQLERFEDLKKAALEKTKNLQQTIAQKQNIIDRITQETKELHVVLQEQETVEKQLQEINQQEIILQKTLTEHEAKKAYLHELHKKYELILIQKKQYLQQLDDVEKQIQQLQQEYEKIAHKQQQNIDIAMIEQEHQKTRTIVMVHQEKLNKRLELKDQYLSLQEKKQNLEKDVLQAQAILTQNYEVGHKILVEQIEQLKQQQNLQEKKVALAHIQLQKHIEQLKTEHDNIEDQTKKLHCYVQYEKEYELHKNQFQMLQAQKGMLEKQIAELQHKQLLTSNNNDPSCPLCEQNLSTSRKKFLDQKFQQTQTQLEQELITLVHQITLLEQQIKLEQQQLQGYKQDYEKLQTAIAVYQAHQLQLEKDTQHTKQEELAIQEIITKQSILQKELANHSLQYQNQIKEFKAQEQNSAYQTLIKKIEVLKQTAQTLAYNKEEHEKDYKKLQQLEKDLITHQELQKEIAQQEQRKKHIQEFLQHIEKIKAICMQLDQNFEIVKNIPQELAEHAHREIADKQQLQKLLQEKNNIQQKKTVFDVHTQKIKTLSQEQNLIEKDIKIINHEIQDFSEIAKALGKDGLQALLIEQALPEIEQEANILLAQLTDNQTQIFIESLRDLKKGGSKETLDIKISDSIGVRPYEMFSGGEAFRIDFALRIAISKLLARRAGTALQTLIIDEGFGSQDDDGLQLIMDSILKIQDNFAKVIIVSHLASMKEQFPVQFLVQKKVAGSTISVIEQG